MKRVPKFGMLAVLGLIFCAPAFAHHSFAAEYDGNQSISITGTVTKLEWTNPHVFLHLEVRDASCIGVAWTFEMASPNALLRRGWNKNSLVAGQTVTVEAYPSKVAQHAAKARSVKLSDGRILYALSPGDEEQTR